MQPTPLSILKDILSRFDDREVVYSMIHGREIFDGGDVSDVDLAFNESPLKVVLPILEEMQNENMLLIVHALHYDVPGCYYFIVAIRTNDSISYLHLDCLYDSIGINKYLIKSHEFTHERIKLAGVYKPRNEVEAVYLLIKKTKKNTLTPEAVSYIKNLVPGKEDEAVLFSEKVAGKQFSGVVNNLLKAEPDISAVDMKKSLKNAVASYQYKHFLRLTLRLVWQFLRGLKRVANPSGIFVVVLGPDGSGKSTIANLVMTNICDGYRKSHRFHWRPGCMPKLGRAKKSDGAIEVLGVDSNAPDMEYKYGVTVSAIRYMYYLLDFIIGADILISMRRIKSTVIVAERYYYDYFVHPARYAFKLPGWIFKLGFIFVRKPDLLILLDNDPDVIWSRKKELTKAEIERQIIAYREQVKKHKHGLFIKTDNSPEEVSRRVVWEILAHTNRKNGHNR